MTVGSVDLGIMAMKGSFTQPRAPELEHLDKILFSVIPKTYLFLLDGGYTSFLSAVDTA